MAEFTEGPTRKTAALLLIVVFVLGAVCGAALFYLGQRSVEPRHRPAGGAPPDHPMARLTRDLNLDAEQQAQIHEILEEQRLQLRGFLDGSHAKIRAVLRPEQQERFDALRPAEGEHPPGPPPPGHGPPPGHPPPPPPNR